MNMNSMLEKKVDKFLNPKDEEWIRKILERSRLDADSDQAEEDNQGYHRDPMTWKPGS